PHYHPVLTTIDSIYEWILTVLCDSYFAFPDFIL
uniref:Uncharacterized protein n=1 Tax=Ciona intestinalis TaxID=7719 RepID=H2Y0T1_CIOIN